MPLAGKVLTLSKLFGSRDQIAAGALGNVHARVGHADDVFDGEAVSGKAGDAEASCNGVLAQHGIGGEPLPQALGQNRRLIRASFGHEDDELVAAIAGHHVRLARLLLQQAAYSRQHQIAFEVPHGVVDLFELVEIDEHH